ncbi:hypothetical protein PEC18_12210 [Paucibacter sp. O1-1]|nr:hypothetical protein [Paucibacter sp. O1-1]MDA3826580.1 hypothetical protein [Paucibacter sp. O1-1]
MNIDLSGSVDQRADRAADHMNMSQRHMLASGLLLGSIKADCAHGEFLALIEERGFEQRSAQRAMQYAQFILSRSESDRELLMGLPKSKVIALAGADGAVIEQLLADGGEHIESLSVRGLMERVRELEAEAVDRNVQLEAAEAELEAAEKKLKKSPTERADKVPVVVAELRAEIAAQAKTAELSIGAFHTIGMDTVGLGAAGAHDWADGTLRLAVAALQALRLQLDGLLAQYLRELPDGAEPTLLSSLTPLEAAEAAERFKTLLGVHDYEKRLRAWEREQEKPRGKGRPSTKPEAPKGGA